MRTLLMPQKFKGLSNSRGNTILGVLCLIAASVAAFQMTLSNSTSVNSGIKNSRILSARDVLEARIKSYSSMGTTFRSSMFIGIPVTENAELRNCVLGTGPNPCQAGVKTPVALYYPIYSDVGGTGTLRKISSPDVANLSAKESTFYDNKGNLCVPNSTGSIEANCPFFEVTTSFIATCATGSSCTTAESISVNYMIKAATTSLSGSSSQNFASFPMADIDHSAPEVAVLDILPATPGSASSNVTISLLATENTLSLESIKTALQKLGVKKGNIEEYALAFQQSGINDLSKLEFLLKVGQLDPTWMRLVSDSGITNHVIANALYWSKNPWTPTLLAAVAAAVEDIKVPEVAWVIADNLVTDPALAKQMAESVSKVSNPNVAAGIIEGGHYKDPVKVEKISAAVSHIANPYAGYLAEAGITDVTIANQITSIVSVLTNPYGSGWIIVGGGGDVTKTQELLNESLNSTWTAGTPESTTTTTTPPAEAPTVTAPVEISLMPTCTTCAPVTY